MPLGRKSQAPCPRVQPAGFPHGICGPGPGSSEATPEPGPEEAPGWVWTFLMPVLPGSF